MLGPRGKSADEKGEREIVANLAGMSMGIAGPNPRGSSNGRVPRHGARASGPARLGLPAAGSADDGGGKAATSGKLAFLIPSDFESGRDVQQRIIDDVQRQGFSEQCLFAIKLALEEALVNAIRHGNQLNPAKKVRIEARVTTDRAEITIEDEGPGFDRTCIPDPTKFENLERPCGRGILLIESYMSKVKWSRGGRRVWMIKNNEPDQRSRKAAGG